MPKLVFVAGHQGMVGSAICKKLSSYRDKEVLVRPRAELDLTNQDQVSNFFNKNHVEEVYLAAAKVGGIYANNTYPAEFIYENLMIQNNLIHSAYHSGVSKLLFLGSSCIYPKHSDQPIQENALLGGPLEQTNEPYAIAKIAGIKLCQAYNRQYQTDFRCLMPTNLYGENDNFDPESGHVIPALIYRIHQAKLFNAPQVEVWGSGNVKREFLHVSDLASACVFIMNLSKKEYQSATSDSISHLNVGFGKDCTIKEVAKLIAHEIGYAGKLIFDKTKPDGTPRKLLDSNKLQKFGWKPTVDLKTGINRTYKWFLSNYNQG